MEAYFAALAEPKELIWVDAADHFFSGALDEFENAIFQIGASL
jgi:alpha/beta superfamily hydrolase